MMSDAQRDHYLDLLPEQDADFDESGIRATVSANSSPEQLQGWASLLAEHVHDLIRRVFNESMIRARALQQSTAALVNAAVQKIGGAISATVQAVTTALIGIWEWVRGLA